MPFASSRRSFIKQAGAIAATSMVGFPSVVIPRRKQKLGVALVGLGRYSQGRLAPGLALTEHCELRGIVTGSPDKIPVWQERYGIPDANVYDYDSLDDIADNDDIDVVYIVTPTGLHARDAIRAANAGKHVWGEKPMAMDEAECQAMIDAANTNGVFLSIGYRMQHEPNTQTVIRYATERPFGAITEVRSGAGYNGAHRDPTNWRRIAHLGGGPLYDMGVYPINAIRYATGMEPVAVTGRLWSERTEMYDEVEEFAEFTLEMSNGLMAYGETAFGKSSGYLDVTCADGWYHLRPFQSYSGVKGEASNGTVWPADPNHQQARQMDNDARAILEGRGPRVPGEDGMADVRIVNAIRRSSEQGGTRITL
ncbi:MAG: Gfo/Idh/MocA family oxidoreductase [Rhodothermales bacterium]